jgi:hypothetical protein
MHAAPMLPMGVSEISITFSFCSITSFKYYSISAMRDSSTCSWSSSILACWPPYSFISSLSSISYLVYVLAMLLVILCLLISWDCLTSPRPFFLI